jgi:hypothetical protein
MTTNTRREKVTPERLASYLVDIGCDHVRLADQPLAKLRELESRGACKGCIADLIAADRRELEKLLEARAAEVESLTKDLGQVVRALDDVSRASYPPRDLSLLMGALDDARAALALPSVAEALLRARRGAK